MTNPPWTGPDAIRTLWNTSLDAMVLTDADGLILAANPAYCALHELVPDQLVGQSLAVIFPEAARPAAMAHYRAVFQSRNRPRLYPAVTQLRDASQRLVESRVDFLTQEDRLSAMLSSVRVLREKPTVDRTNLGGTMERLTTDFPIARARMPYTGSGDSAQTAAEVLIAAIHYYGIDIVLGD